MEIKLRIQLCSEKFKDNKMLKNIKLKFSKEEQDIHKKITKLCSGKLKI